MASDWLRRLSASRKARGNRLLELPRPAAHLRFIAAPGGQSFEWSCLGQQHTSASLLPRAGSRLNGAVQDSSTPPLHCCLGRAVVWMELSRTAAHLRFIAAPGGQSFEWSCPGQQHTSASLLPRAGSRLNGAVQARSTPPFHCCLGRAVVWMELSRTAAHLRFIAAPGGQSFESSQSVSGAM